MSPSNDPLRLIKEDLSLFFSSFKKRAIFLIIAIGLAVFSSGLFNDFVGDDYGQIVDNTTIQSIWNIGSAFSMSTFYSGGMIFGTYYKPLMQIYYTIIYAVFDLQVFWFHFFQLLLHIANTIFLFLFFEYFFKKQTSFSLALIFLVHPINSESVYSIAATQEVLFFFFGILAMLKLAQSKEGSYPFSTAILLLLSMLSKETGILFVAAATSYAFFFKQKQVLKLLSLAVPITILYLALKTHAVGLAVNPGNTPIDRLDLLHRAINIPEIVWFYIKTFFFPMHLAHGYHFAYDSIDFKHFFLPLGIICSMLSGIIFFAIQLHTKQFLAFKKYVLFTSIIIFGLLLHLQIIPLDFTTSERWFYFPIIGALGLLGIFIENLTKNNVPKKYIVFLFWVILAIFSARTFIRGFDWKDHLTLSYKDLAVVPGDYASLAYISSKLLISGDVNGAREYAERSITIFPSPRNYNTLGLTYLKEGDYAKAEETYFTGLKYGSYYYLLYSNLAGLYIDGYGNLNENIRFMQEAVKRFPQSSRLWSILAVLEYRNGDLEAAKTAIKTAYTLKPNENILGIYTAIMQNQQLKIQTGTKH